MRNRWLVLIASMTLAVLAQAGPASSQQGPIKVGLDVPASGGDAFEGHEISQGAQLAFEEQNAAGGVGGRRVETVLGDNQCDPAVGVNSVRRLVNVDKVDAMIGSGCSSVTLAVMPILQQGGVPSLDVTATNPRITQQSGVGGNPWKFRLNLNDELMATVFARRVIAKEVKSLAIFAVQTDYGRGASEIFKRELPGVRVVSEEYYPIGQAEFRSILTRTKSLNPEGFLLIADYPEAAQIISQAREVGMSGFKVYGRGTVVTPEMLKLLQNACWADGAKEANFWAPNEATKDLANRYQARFKEPLTRTSGMGYFGAQTLLQAMKTIKGDINAKSIRDALEKIDFNLPGLGQVKFDDHHQVHYPMYILAVQNCQVNILETVPTN